MKNADLYLDNEENIINIRETASKELQPVLSKLCALLLMSNLAYPEWVSINCHERLLTNVFCFSEKPKITRKSSGMIDISCPKSEIFNSNLCFRFIWHVYVKELLQVPKLYKDFRGTAHSISIIRKLSFLVNAIKHQQFSILSPHQSSDGIKFISFVYEGIWFKKQWTQSKESPNSGFTVSTNKAHSLKHTLNISYSCENTQTISHLYVCDGDNDCKDNKHKEQSSDEKWCTCNAPNENCKEVCTNLSCTCSQLYQRMKNGTCVSYYKPHMDTFQLENDSSLDLFHCSNGQNISVLLVNDMVSDCGQSADDEKHLISVLEIHIQFKCRTPGQIPCRSGHSRCFNISDICSYRLSLHNFLIPCRTGEHLEDCSVFECNLMFQCPGYYCIPYGYQCDGKWDCPFGEEELGCSLNSTCTNMFKCKLLQRCIHLGDVCDGVSDCHLGEDEQMCDIKDTCPTLCRCFHYALVCESEEVHAETLKSLPYIAYFIRRTNILDLQFVHGGPHIEVLILTENKIVNICPYLTEISSLKMFDVSLNQVEEIFAGCFKKLKALKTVAVRRNRLLKLGPQSFESLQKISLLDLSSNRIDRFQNAIFEDVKQVGVFNLTNNPLLNLGSDIRDIIFSAVLFQTVLTDSYRICCMTSTSTICSTLPPWYTSCSRLLADSIMRYSFTIVSLLIILWNLASFSQKVNQNSKLKVKAGQQKNVSLAFNFIVCFVNSGDFACGLYLTVIWSADAFYNDSFLVNDMNWSKNVFCCLAFLLLLSFSVSVPFSLTFLSVARCMITVYPFDSNFKSKTFVLRYLVAGHSVFLTIAFAFTFRNFMDGKITSPLCSPFTDPTDSLLEVKITIWLVTGFQFFALLFISCLYVYLLIYLKNYSRNSVASPSKMNPKTIIQLVVVTVSNLICWLPSGIIHVTTLLLPRYPTALLEWTAIAIVPINSVTNPVLFLMLSKAS